MPIDSLRRFLPFALAILLIACWLGGGATRDSRPVDDGLLLLSLPVLVLAVAALASSDQPLGWPTRSAIGAILVVAAIPLLQLLPLPASLWQMADARQALAQDLSNAGIAPLAGHWTMAPDYTEQAFWSLLPASAMFLATLTLSANQRRRLLQLVLLLVLFNVGVAFFQAGLPRDSSLRLYPTIVGGFGGLLVNTNHQGTACIIGMVIAVGLAVEARVRVQNGQANAHAAWWYIGLAAAFLLLVPLSTSRAAMVIALPALAAALIFTGGLRLARIGRSKRAAGLAIAAVVLAVLGVRGAMSWMEVDKAEEIRHTLATATAQVGAAYAPLGSGIGSYTEAFEPLMPSSLWLAPYINHAHNEYAQWWLTGGWLAMAVLAGVLVLLAIFGWRLLSLPGRGRHAAIAGACFVAILAALAHSWADYPLRTTTLMATVAALAGVMLASLAEALDRDKRKLEAAEPSQA